MDLGAKCIEQGIVRGAILHSGKFDFVDHGKLFVIIGENEDQVIGFFFINTEPAPFIKRNPAFFNMQMIIKRSDYPDILRYDSFVDCHDITHISKRELTHQIACGDADIRGMLNEQDCELILDVVRESDLFTEEQKSTFFK